MHILIADENTLVRRGVRDILAESFPDAQFDEVSDTQAVFSRLAARSYHLLILDIAMVGRSGLDAMKDIKNNYPRLPVIMLSVSSNNEFAVRSLRSGAAAYINKDNAAEELAVAAVKIMAGGHYVSPAVAERLIATLDLPGNKPGHESLSNRELEVLRMIALGMALTDIGHQLHLSVKTVSSYRARILEKMRMKTNSELIRYAVEHKLIP